jgi:hypothetical protein
MDPEKLYRPFDPREKVDYSPLLAKRGQTVTTDDLLRAAQVVCARHQAELSVVRWIGDNAVVLSVVLGQGNFAGQTNIAGLHSELTKAVTKVCPTAIVDLIDQSQISADYGMTFRSRAYFRIRRDASGDGRGVTPS